MIKKGVGSAQNTQTNNHIYHQSPNRSTTATPIGQGRAATISRSTPKNISI
jgi:hypothetical protein